MKTQMKMTAELRRLRDWQKNNAEGDFSIPMIAADIGVDKVKVNRMFRYVQRKFEAFYKEQEERGHLFGSPTQKWMTAIVNFEAQWGLVPVMYDRATDSWSLPDFRTKQENSGKRVEHHIKSAQTVVREMTTYNEELLITGRKPAEIMSGLKQIGEAVANGDNAAKCPTCGDPLADTWVVCPTCGQPLQDAIRR
jgi:hypothetical protein